MQKNSGFIHIIALVIVFVIILIYFGKNPIDVWAQIKPLFVFVFDIFLKILDWLVRITTQLWQNK